MVAEVVAIVDGDSWRLGYDCDMEGAKSITFLMMDGFCLLSEGARPFIYGWQKEREG